MLQQNSMLQPLTVNAPKKTRFTQFIKLNPHNHKYLKKNIHLFRLMLSREMCLDITLNRV